MKIVLFLQYTLLRWSSVKQICLCLPTICPDKPAMVFKLQLLDKVKSISRLVSTSRFAEVNHTEHRGRILFAIPVSHLS